MRDPRQCVMTAHGREWVCDRCGYRTTSGAVARWCDAAGEISPSVSSCRHIGKKAGDVKVSCDCDDARVTSTPAHRCQIHTRCLPHYNPTGAALAAWWERRPESDLYQLCAGCGDFEPAD